MNNAVTYQELTGVHAHHLARSYSESGDVDLFAYLAARPEWMTQAACKGMDTNDWFPSRGDTRGGRAAAARAVCAECPVQQDCLLYATTTPLEHHGIWGGLSERQRRFMHRERVA